MTCRVLWKKEPGLVLTLDLNKREVNGSGRTWKVNLPDSRRTALTEGYWDSTSLILENLPRARKIAEALPYMTNFNS